MDPAKASNPPAYSALDTSDPDGQLATNAGQMIISYCRDTESNLNSLKLRKLMEMVVSYVNKETGVMPSVATTPAASIPPNNNPTDPSEWDWSQWEKKHLTTSAGMREVRFLKRNLICTILGKSLENNLDKTKAILEHSLFKNSVNTVLDSATVTGIVYRAKTCDQIVEKLFDQYQMKQKYFSPTGMIKAAISLGYLTRQDIEELYNMR